MVLLSTLEPVIYVSVGSGYVGSRYQGTYIHIFTPTYLPAYINNLSTYQYTYTYIANICT